MSATGKVGEVERVLGKHSPQHSESGCGPGVNRRGDLFLWGTRSLDAHPHGLSDPPPQHGGKAPGEVIPQGYAAIVSCFDSNDCA